MPNASSTVRLLAASLAGPLRPADRDGPHPLLLTVIYESYGEIGLTENHIKQLHGVLLRHSVKDERHRGGYKKFPNPVQATYPDGRIEILFQTATPFDTPRLMSELVTATNAAFEQGAVHAVVVIARFAVDFLAIHPFQDGNGRLARAMTTLLLLRAGYEYVPYASPERVIEDDKQEYYVALRTSQLAMRANPAAFGRGATTRRPLEAGRRHCGRRRPAPTRSSRKFTHAEDGSVRASCSALSRSTATAAAWSAPSTGAASHICGRIQRPGRASSRAAGPRSPVSTRSPRGWPRAPAAGVQKAGRAGERGGRALPRKIGGQSRN